MRIVLEMLWPMTEQTAKSKKVKKPTIPESLASTIKMIREELDGFQSQAEFATSLRKQGRRFRRYVGGPKTLSGLEQRTTSLKYEHLENYRDYVGMPAGVLLLFSRMMANKRNSSSDSEAERNEILIRKIRKILDGITDDTEFDAVELRRWTQIMGRGDLKI